MSNNLKGKVAVVTGSGQGIGKAIALEMAKEGAKVVTNNRKPGSTSAFTYGEAFEKSLSQERKEWVLQKDKELKGDAETTAKQIKDMGGEAVPFYGDIGDFKVAGKLIQTAIDSFGKIDILVNNHGTFMHAPIWEMSREQWDHILSNKPTGYFNTIRQAAPHMMKQKWGRIINCTSGAWLGTFDHCNYSSANAGVVGLSRAAARELWSYGITCNIYAPGAFTRAIANLSSRARQQASAGSPIIKGEFLDAMEAGPTAEVIAPMVTYLATDAAANISGTVFQVSARGGVFGIYSEPAVVSTIEKKEGLWTVDELMEQVPKGLLKGYQNPAVAAQPTK